jgi:hypothetical protein
LAIPFLSKSGAYIHLLVSMNTIPPAFAEIRTSFRPNLFQTTQRWLGFGEIIAPLNICTDFTHPQYYLLPLPSATRLTVSGSIRDELIQTAAFIV